MKRIDKIVMAALVMIALVVSMSVAWAGVTATPLKVLSVQEAALWGATHVLELDYNSFKGLTTSTNTTTVITNAVPAGSMVKFELMKLDQAFDNDTYTDSLLVYSGWAADTDGFFESTEVAADGTEVFANVTPIVQSEGTTVLYRATWGWKYNSTATNILTTIKQNSHGSCISSNVAGKIRFFYRIVSP
jgi:hypothetical protein